MSWIRQPNDPAPGPAPGPAHASALAPTPAPAPAPARGKKRPRSASPGSQGSSSGRSKLERRLESAKEGWAKKIAVDEKVIKAKYERKTAEGEARMLASLEAGFRAMAALQAKLATQMAELWQQKAALEVACAENVAPSRAAVVENMATEIEKMKARAV
ncbi:MAG: hypothetical protein M1826_005259 [Phylliscum demangeonii]|nr:MAG: hypothetical protein M1826_005259 [Phylliscum demangeonii]